MIHISSALDRVWFEVARRWIDELPWDSPLIGQPLSSFPLPGRWVLQVDMDGRTDLVTDTHCVALGVERSRNGRWRRFLADNNDLPSAAAGPGSAVRGLPRRSWSWGPSDFVRKGTAWPRSEICGLRPFQQRFVRAATNRPGVHLAALSLPRGNGKSWLAARIVERVLTRRAIRCFGPELKASCAQRLSNRRDHRKFASRGKSWSRLGAIGFSIAILESGLSMWRRTLAFG